MKAIILWLGLCLAPLGFAQDILTVKSKQPFTPAIETLQEAILEKDYTISIVQRCDFGLKQAGFLVEKYRVVYFGKHKEIKAISDAYPELSPFLPLRIVVVSKGKTSILSAMNPAVFLETVKDKSLMMIVKRWQQDIQNILYAVASSQ